MGTDAGVPSLCTLSTSQHLTFSNFSLGSLFLIVERGVGPWRLSRICSKYAPDIWAFTRKMVQCHLLSKSKIGKAIYKQELSRGGVTLMDSKHVGSRRANQNICTPTFSDIGDGKTCRRSHQCQRPRSEDSPVASLVLFAGFVLCLLIPMWKRGCACSASLAAPSRQKDHFGAKMSSFHATCSSLIASSVMAFVAERTSLFGEKVAG